jgi:hypothetical protein
LHCSKLSFFSLSKGKENAFQLAVSLFFCYVFQGFSARVPRLGTFALSLSLSLSLSNLTVLFNFADAAAAG